MGRGKGMGGGRRMGGGSGRGMFSGWKPLKPREPSQTEQQTSGLAALRQQAQAFQATVGHETGKQVSKGGQATTLRVSVDKERCIGCGVCINICPQGAITMESTGKG